MRFRTKVSLDLTRRKKTRAVMLTAGVLGGLVLIWGVRQPSAVHAQSAPPIVIDAALGSLKTVPTPEPGNLSKFLKADSSGNVSASARAAAIALGKALFWDQAVGSSDANVAASNPGQACASCHFNAGADSRTKNQLNPGFRAVPPDNTFTAPFGVNYQLHAGDFPFHRLSNPDDRLSTVLFDTNDIASSQGVFREHFVDVIPGNVSEVGSAEASIFNAKGVREVEPRNTPTTINAVFNYRNFWDGRARHEFNGVNPIGDLDPFARVLVAGTDPNNGASTVNKIALAGNLRLENASLASQAVGPTLSDLEMSFNGRTFAKLGKKMLAFQRGLSNQLVAPNDSVFYQKTTVTDPVLGTITVPGPFPSNYPKPGISNNYATLIQAAFQPGWWKSNNVITFGKCTTSGATTLPSAGGGDQTICVNPPPPSGTVLTTNQYTQMEYNFSLFWGIAIQMYEATLRADDSAYDQAFDSGDPLAFSSPSWGDQQKQGLLLFQDKAKCIACHSGPELTNASVKNVEAEQLERMTMGNNQIAVYDNGFYNTAATRCAGDQAGNAMPPCDDAGIGTTIGPLNLPLSFSRFFQLVLAGDPNVKIVCQNQPQACSPIPTIAPRPAEGIGPAPLAAGEPVAVVGAFKTPGLRNVELTAPFFHNGGLSTLGQVIDFYNRGGNFPEVNQANFDPNVVTLGLTQAEKDALVALMNSLTDQRVRNQQAPFDHPQLVVPNFGTLAAAGANGACAGAGSCAPLKTFAAGLLP